jgi:cytochrome c biogenesis protein ResB
MPVHIAFTRMWPFVLVLTVFLIVLASRLFLKFSLAGFGLWLALWAGMYGTADASVTHVMVPRHEYARSSLPFTLRLEDFGVTRYQTGEPMEYRAKVSLQDIDRRGAIPDRGGDASEHKENSVLKTLRVNHPVNYKGHQVYLMDYDSAKGDLTDYCIVMVTRQPWRWLVFAGILVLLAGALKTFFV